MVETVTIVGQVSVKRRSPRTKCLLGSQEYAWLVLSRIAVRSHFSYNMALLYYRLYTAIAITTYVHFLAFYVDSDILLTQFLTPFSFTLTYTKYCNFTVVLIILLGYAVIKENQGKVHLNLWIM